MKNIANLLFEAKMLKEIPKGTTFTIRLVSPLTSGFSEYSPL